MLTTGFPRFTGDLFGSFILELARKLVGQGIEVEVVAPHERGIPRDERLDGVRVRRFRYAFPATWQRVAYGGGIPTNIARSWLARLQVPMFLLGFWLKAVRSVRGCDLVHCHWTISGLIGFLATRLWRRPLVLTVRGSDIHLLEKGMVRRLHQKIYGWMDMVVAVSEDIGRKLEEAGVERRKIRVVYNGVDERFQPGEGRAAREQLGLPQDRFILLFVGLLVPVKGIDVLLEAMQRVDDPRLLCVLVGDGELRRDLQWQAEDGGLGEQVIFAGRQPSQEIPVWMQAADLLILPSRSEGRPNVVLEAQACGLPVIATRVGGTPELICDGENGLLVESGDPDGLARGIGELMDDPERRQQLGQAGRYTILQDGLTWDTCANRMQDVYREALARG